MSDLISRQALCEYALNQKDKSVSPNDIMRFPSAQPFDEGINVPINVNDCISRQAAIDFIDAGHLCNPNEPRWSDNEVVNFLKSRPSAQPETHEERTETHACDCIDRQAVERLDWFTKLYCRDKSITDDLAFRCRQCEFEMPDKTCLVKVMARKLCPDYKGFGAMGDL